MKKLLCLCISMYASTSFSSMNDGLYYAYWVYGNENYSSHSILANNPQKKENNFYFHNAIDEGSYNEIYMEMKNNSVHFFYKHMEIETSPTIGWASAFYENDFLLIDEIHFKYVGDFTSGSNHTKEIDKNSDVNLVGKKLKGRVYSLKNPEVIPLEKINNDEYKLSCLRYLEVNRIDESYIIDMPNDDKRAVFFNTTDICGSSFDESDDITATEINNGWIVFKRVK
ncbi:hypothetical protein V2I52_15150 [Brenneria sp. g21c3]|uniref:hypothetical protein n=1 Tax=Brenneria sp. g21c3 TaxID=3093893 RepID=UPI002E9FB6AF|nr:hypothetical protein [Brenneria sp. g21c3]